MLINFNGNCYHVKHFHLVDSENMPEAALQHPSGHQSILLKNLEAPRGHLV